jgi:hypothetical protein
MTKFNQKLLELGVSPDEYCKFMKTTKSYKTKFLTESDYEEILQQYLKLFNKTETQSEPDREIEEKVQFDEEYNSQFTDESDDFIEQFLYEEEANSILTVIIKREEELTTSDKLCFKELKFWVNREQQKERMLEKQAQVEVNSAKLNIDKVFELPPEKRSDKSTMKYLNYLRKIHREKVLELKNAKTKCNNLEWLLLDIEKESKYFGEYIYPEYELKSLYEIWKVDPEKDLLGRIDKILQRINSERIKYVGAGALTPTHGVSRIGYRKAAKSNPSPTPVMT